MRLLTFVTAVLFATGCVGGVDEQDQPPPAPDSGSGGGGGMAKALYTGTVHPTMLAKCSGAGCHAQPGATGIYGFALPDADASYAQVTSVPTLVGTYTAASARLVTKIDGSHNALTYTSDELAKITAWLTAEATERSDSGEPPPVDPIAKLAEWTGCMSLENFTTADMKVWGTMNATTNQRCADCHAAGLYAFYTGNGQAGENEENFFTAITTQKDFLLKYFTVDATGNVIVNTSAFQNAGVALPDDTNHPAFNPTTNVGMTALTQFSDLTKARQTAGTCDPPRLVP